MVDSSITRHILILNEELDYCTVSGTFVNHDKVDYIDFDKVSWRRNNWQLRIGLYFSSTVLRTCCELRSAVSVLNGDMEVTVDCDIAYDVDVGFACR
jgi:hypothetical protein